MTTRDGVDTWKAQTTAFDRVQSIAVTLTKPRSADWIADQAAVAGNTAREHLGRLVEMNVLRTRSGDGTTRYEPDPLYTRMQAMRELLDDNDRDDLLALRADMQDQIESWRSEFAVDSPEELRTKAGSADSAADTRRLRQMANDWNILNYRLQLVEETIEQYDEYVGNNPAPA